MSKVIAIVSGGLDSTTLVYELTASNHKVEMISFDYGQRHKRELEFARATAKSLGLKHDIIDLTGLTHLISNSALTAGVIKENVSAMHAGHPYIEVPDGHYAEDTMKATVVPNRNMIMISIAAGIAVNRGADYLAVGVHGGDHFIYPDCRPRFIGAVNAAIVIGNSGFGSIPEQYEGTAGSEFVLAPFLHSTKTMIAYRAIMLGIPLNMTWSCYKGGTNHCGRCGTCVERLEAIAEATEWARQNRTIPDGLHAYDQTVYDDDEFWKTVSKENGNA
jgi:7-cyano-7-deazaguanine synthase